MALVAVAVPLRREAEKFTRSQRRVEVPPRPQDGTLSLCRDVARVLPGLYSRGRQFEEPRQRTRPTKPLDDMSCISHAADGTRTFRAMQRQFRVPTTISVRECLPLMGRSKFPCALFEDMLGMRP